MNENAALARFNVLRLQIQAELAHLQAAVDDHFGLNPDDVTWANVGDMGKTLQDLKNINRRVLARPEDRP